MRYLTENFALRHLIESYMTQIDERSSGRRGGVSMKTCDLDDLSDDLSCEAWCHLEAHRGELMDLSDAFGLDSKAFWARKMVTSMRTGSLRLGEWVTEQPARFELP